MSDKQFAADLDPERGWPRMRFNFANGWSASLLLRAGTGCMDAMLASVAAAPTGEWGKGKTEIGPTEAFSDEAIDWISEIRSRGTDATLPADVVRLVIAARRIAFAEPDKAAIAELDAASEAFADRVPWADQPEDPVTGAAT